MQITVPTAGSLTTVPAQPTPHRRPADLGNAQGPSVMVNADDLAAILRRLVPSGADITYSNGWWALRCFGSGISVGGWDLDELGTQAVSRLRQLVETAAEHHRAPLVWLVRLSSDRDLRAWLNIPTGRAQ